MPQNCDVCDGSGLVKTNMWVHDRPDPAPVPCMCCNGGGVVFTPEEMRVQMDALGIPKTYADIAPGTDLSDKIRQLKFIP